MMVGGRGKVVIIPNNPSLESLVTRNNDRYQWDARAPCHVPAADLFLPDNLSPCHLHISSNHQGRDSAVHGKNSNRWKVD